MTPRVLLLLALVASAVAPRGQDPDPQSAIQLDLRIGSVRYAVSAAGTCLWQPHGTLYEVPAAQWNARHRDGQRYTNMAFWRVQPGGDMFSLGILLGPTMHRISTVRVDGKGEPRGRGRVTLAPNGAAGVFLIDATSDTGARVAGTITCGTFTRPVEDNG